MRPCICFTTTFFTKFSGSTTFNPLVNVSSGDYLYCRTDVFLFSEELMVIPLLHSCSLYHLPM
ncbi:hypothetical protein CW304_04215 [Bacillus sp. UFRGS-B20]|nr:hypothetical protein CW304_04215 [Bacillus sp. UFRGS-B20]